MIRPCETVGISEEEFKRCKVDCRNIRNRRDRKEKRKDAIK